MGLIGISYRVTVRDYLRHSSSKFKNEFTLTYEELLLIFYIKIGVIVLHRRRRKPSSCRLFSDL